MLTSIPRNEPDEPEVRHPVCLIPGMMSPALTRLLAQSAPSLTQTAMRQLLQLSLLLATILLAIDAPAQAQRGSRGSQGSSASQSSSRGSSSRGSSSRGSSSRGSSSRGSISPSHGSSSSRGSSIGSSSRGSSSSGTVRIPIISTPRTPKTTSPISSSTSRGITTYGRRTSSPNNIVRIPRVSAPITTPRISIPAPQPSTPSIRPNSRLARGSSINTGTNSWIRATPSSPAPSSPNIMVVTPTARIPRARVPRLSGSSSTKLSSARRRAQRAVEQETTLPRLQWERSSLIAPRASTQRRIPLAGAEILRRYERPTSSARSSSKSSKALTPISESASTAVASRADFAKRARRNEKLKPSSDSEASSGSSLSLAAKGSASSLTAMSKPKTLPKSLPSQDGDGSSGAGSSGGGWDDNFGDDDNGYGDDGYGDDDSGHHDDHHGHHNGHHNDWHWWPNWGWHSNWGLSYSTWHGWHGWHSWWGFPLYYPHYGSWWVSDYNPAPVISTTIYTTEIIEIPVVQEVFVPAENQVLAGAVVNSSSEVRSALQRAAVEYLSLGDRAFAEARYGDAVRHYARAVECSPQDAVLQLVLSDALFATGDYHYAAHCLRRALELEPDLLEVEFDKRSFYGEVTDYDRHILLLERYLSDHILDDDARLLLGANYLFGSNPEGTVALFGDTFGEAIRNSNAGRLLLAAAERAIAAR